MAQKWVETATAMKPRKQKKDSKMLTGTLFPLNYVKQQVLNMHTPQGAGPHLHAVYYSTLTFPLH